MSIGLFVGAWLGSIAAPIVLIISLLFRWWSTVLVLVAAFSTSQLLPLKTSQTVKAWFCHGFRVYWRSHSVCYECELAPNTSSPTVLAVHPHGCYCMGFAVLYSQALLKHVHFCFAHVLYSSSLFRAFTTIIGRPASADRSFFVALMQRRQTIALLPGGFEEAALCCMATDRVYLRERKGWVKYALQHGYSLTPVFTFGERETYATAEALAPLRLRIARFGLAGQLLSMLLVFPRGCWWCPILPRGRRLHTVVGAPLPPPVAPAADASSAIWGELVDEFHSHYIAALVALYDRHKIAYYGMEAADAMLEIW